MSRSLVFLKKKKEKFLYLEDLYINGISKLENQLLLSSSKGLNSFALLFPKAKKLNNYLFYAPVYVKLSVSISMITKQLKLFLKGMLQGFFLEYRMVGLGFKVKRSGEFSLRTIKFDIGFSHFIKMPLTGLARICRIKKRFLIFSIDYNTIKVILKQIQSIRKHNPYKLRGLKLTGAKYRLKPGKKQTKR